MDNAARLILKISYGLGLLALVAAVVLRISDRLVLLLYVSSRGALLFAVTLFLCTIASYAFAKSTAR